MYRESSLFHPQLSRRHSKDQIKRTAMTKETKSQGHLPAWLSGFPAKTKRIITSVGPWVLGQFDEVSKKYTKHQLRQAGVEILTSAMSAEMATLAEARKLLLLRIANASDPVEGVTATANLRHVEEEVRRFGVFVAALDYAHQSREGGTSPEVTILDAVWLDRFDEFARRQNEPWRRELLAKALAKEAEQPGRIGLRALWLIGTLEEHIFRAFATILDLSSTVDLEYVLPSFSATDTPIPGCDFEEANTISHLTFMLQDTGVLASDQSVLTSNGRPMVSRYGDKSYRIEVPKRFQIRGSIILSPLGTVLSSLYEPKFNPLGAEIFQRWIDGLGIYAVEIPKGEAQKTQTIALE